MDGSATRTKPASTVELDLLVEAGEWADEATLRKIADGVVRAVGDELSLTGETELSLVFTDDAHIQALNSGWRGKDKPTNVLSFPAAPPANAKRLLPRMLGDVIVAFETVRREAELEGKPFGDHLSHLLLHGMLHLLGHDHETDDEAEAMEAIERRVLARLAIDDPYA